MVLKREKENQYTSCKKKGTIKQIYVDYRELIHEVNEKENTRIAAKRSSEKKKPQKMVKSVTTNILDKGSPIPGGFI